MLHMAGLEPQKRTEDQRLMRQKRVHANAESADHERLPQVGWSLLRSHAANSIWRHYWKTSPRIRLRICVSQTADAYRFWDQEIRPNRVDNMRTGQRPPDLGVLKRFRIGMGVLRRHQQLAKHGPADFFYGRTIAAKIESKT